MPDISTGKKSLFALAVLCAAAAIWHAATRRGSSTGAFVDEEFQRHVGQQVARIGGSQAAATAGRRVGVLSFATGSSGPHAAQVDALRAALTESGHPVDVFNAAGSGIALEGHYTPALEAALAKTAPDVLIVLATGDVTALQPSVALDRFVRQGGQLVFVGKLERADSPTLELVRQGAAIAVAMNAGLLSHRRPASRTLDAESPEDYFHKYYTVLTRENVSAMLRTSR